MKKVILDTNIYGEMIFDLEFEVVKKTIPSKFIVYGFKIIRNELRDVPKKIKREGKNFRIAILHIYDEITAHKNLVVTEDIISLAELYYKAYRDLGGIRSKKKIFNDFMIVACASINDIDIVVSEDNKTMLAENALKAYDLVNSMKNKKMPSFIGYLKFKRWLI